MVSSRHIAITLGLLFSAAPLAGQAKRTLRYDLAPGTTGSYVIAVDSATNIKGQGQDINSRTIMKLYMTFRIKSGIKEDVLVEHRLERITMGGDMPNRGEFSFDTTQVERIPQGFDSYSDLIGATLHTKIHPNGATEIDLSPKMTTPMVRQHIHPDVFRMFTVEFPDRPIPVGGSWTTPISLQVGRMGEQRMKVVHTLESSGDGTVFVERELEFEEAEAGGDRPGRTPFSVPHLTTATAHVMSTLDNPVPDDLSWVMHSSTKTGPMEFTTKTTVTVKQTEPPAMPEGR